MQILKIFHLLKIVINGYTTKEGGPPLFVTDIRRSPLGATRYRTLTLLTYIYHSCAIKSIKKVPAF
ncbi:hypothetical protein PSENEW3n2_00000776 [Picochlorum sp. SENEW3]|nr:hypothetical protein PSENEW3n2_00000776 [Picochlorum sp. SENEW3]WPT15697.1 hypothetical protein PSENEW3_00000776 [Picochlorum sp. SENEW3]